MKKILNPLHDQVQAILRKCLILFTMLLTVGLSARARTFDVGDLSYKVLSEADHTVEVSGFIGEPTDVVIPESVENGGVTYSVTSIGYCAFNCCRSLTSVSIPNSVTSIGEAAFNHCESLTSVTIPNSVTSIGFIAFSYCKSLTSVSIPNSVTSIENYAFQDCTSLASVTIPNSVTSIGIAPFKDCSSLEEILVDAGNANYCSDNGILYNKNMTELIQCPGAKKEVTIPNSVTSIEASAFEGCTSLASVTIPNSVTSIGDEVFENCTSLASVTIPNSVTSIRYCAFQRCSSLTSVSISNSVTSIGDFAFYGCTSLASVTIPNSVTSIGDSAFSRCTSLTSVTIPNSVTSIGVCVLGGCTSLEEILVDAGNANYCSNNGILYNKNMTELIQCPGAKKEITIPTSVTSIGVAAFENCTSLTSVTIPNSVTSIGRSAFYQCTSLKTIYSEPTTPPQAESNAFYGVPTDAVVYVPVGTKEAYSQAEGWNYFTDFREKTPTGVSELFVDYDVCPADVYNMQGILVKANALQADVNALAPGLYIIGGRKVLVK